MWRRSAALTAISLLVIATSAMRAQVPAIADAKGQVGLGLALRQLETTAVLMQATAHPDDENNMMLAALGWGQGVRTVVATATRGDGGQNEIGPEIFDALAIARTEELLAVHRMDGAEQYFGRAIDFGYSFSVEETFQKWGRDEIVADYVRLLRMIRPDVVIAMRPDGPGGGQHHQASAQIAREAFLAAGDPLKYPDQLREGLRPWQAKKFYYTGRFGFPGEPPPPAGVRLTPVNLNVYDSLLGESYVDIGSRARSNHKTQGMSQLLSLPGAAFSSGYALTECAIPGLKEKGESSLFDGLDTTVPGLARFVPTVAPDALTSGLAAIAGSVTRAKAVLAEGGPHAAVEPLAAGLKALRDLRRQLVPGPGALPIPDDARFDIDARLELKERQFTDAVALASGLRFEALADDGLVVAGQPLKLTLIAANRGGVPARIDDVSFRGFDGDAGACPDAVAAPGTTYECAASVQVTRQARLSGQYWKRRPDASRYQFEPDAPFGLPFRPTPFRVRFGVTIAGVPLSIERQVEYRYQGTIFSGEKRMELLVVPRFAVEVSPAVAILPSRSLASSRPQGREIRVTIANGGKGASEGDVTLDVPQGWKVTPPSAHVALSREDEAESIKFTVTPAAGTKPGSYTVSAVMAAGADRFTQGFQVVEYPHTRRRHLLTVAQATVKVIDVSIAPGLNVGYIMGVGDQVPAAIEQLGARVTTLDADAIAFGDLSRFDVIVTGVRAYERRADLRASNHRLLEYAAAGGTVLVQYNRDAFNDAQYGPWPAKVSANRVTDERAPVSVLLPQHPAFTWPNRIGDAAWQSWVQERGLQFLGERDARYVDLLQLEDPFPFNSGPKRGALVEARVGKGRWLYLGIGLWRQLPAGTEGAYQLLANLLSLGKSPAAARPRVR
jgi:LmbE family N-acetylglucosaminyl deacetylase